MESNLNKNEMTDTRNADHLLHQLIKPGAAKLQKILAEAMIVGKNSRMRIFVVKYVSNGISKIMRISLDGNLSYRESLVAVHSILKESANNEFANLQIRSN